MKKIIVLIAIAALTSCTSNLYVNRLDNNQKLYPINENNVKVFLNDNELPQSFDKVATIDLKDIEPNINAVQIAKTKAAEIGANGIIKIEEKQSGNTSISINPLRGIGIKEKLSYQYLAIRYKVNGEYIKQYKKDNDDTY